jgi:hypothetical protein
MASYGRDTDDDGAQRSKESTVMGSETRKAQRTTLYICDGIKKKCSKKLWSILGVLLCLNLRIWRLWARTKNEHTMDDFSTLTIREPWLLEKSFYFYCSHLASRNRIDATRSSRFAAWGQVDRNYQKIITKGKGRLSKEFHPSLYEGWLQAELQNNLAHTFSYFVKFEVLETHHFKVWKFSKLMRCSCLRRHYAHACAVWCSWCSLEWLDYPYALVIARATKSRERFCVTSCYLTTKIP